MSETKAVRLIFFGIICILIIWAVTAAFHRKPGVYSSHAGGAAAAAKSDSNVVPWDYKVEQRKVGDLINGDMTLLPDNQLLPNDGNYATGDSIYVLDSMEAVMSARPDGSNDVRLTVWKPVKSYKTLEQANEDLANLKEQVNTDVDLVGVYKTELDGKFREFAVIRLPAGSEVKQPIDDSRYNDFKNKKQVKVQLEIVHDLSNYDLAMPKFRGWSS